MTERVELRQAFTWDCPDCGQENFARAIEPDLSPMEIAELREEFGLKEDEEGIFMLAPKNVTCSNCDKEWETENPDDPDK